MNWKTTATSALTALFVILKGFGIIEMNESETSTVIAALIIVFGWFAKDGTQTGTPSDKLK